MDDSSIFIGVASRFLSLMPGYEVVGNASSGACAIDRIRELKPDLVIMDLAMPGMDGLEATRLLKAALCSPRVLVTSFHDTPEYRSGVEETGADGFLPKMEFGSRAVPMIEEMFDFGD